jgi:hypothetical protein
MDCQVKPRSSPAMTLKWINSTGNRFSAPFSPKLVLKGAAIHHQFRKHGTSSEAGIALAFGEGIATFGGHCD